MKLLKLEIVFIILALRVITIGFTFGKNTIDFDSIDDDLGDFDMDFDFDSDEDTDTDSDKDSDEDTDTDSDKDSADHPLTKAYDDSKSDKCVGKKCRSKKRTKSKLRMKKYYGYCNRCGIAFGGSESGRVINGRPVVPTYKYPWIVAMFKNNIYTCGGALISANFILTAAHCVFNGALRSYPQCRGRSVHESCYVSPHVLRVGLFAGNERTPSDYAAVSRIIAHPMYSSSLKMNDIALLQLASPVYCSATILPVCLPPRDFSRIGTQLITAGSGHNTPEGVVGQRMIREGIVREIDPNHCSAGGTRGSALNNIVCAAGLESGQSSCFGDSGSSLVRRYGGKFYSLGIVSYGKFPRCSERNPVAYTKTYAYLSFIHQNVGDLPQQ